MYSNKTFYNEDKKIWYGQKREILKDSLGALLLKKLRSDPEHISQICAHNDRKYTNAEIADLSISIAKHFLEMRLEQQCDVIGICALNNDLLAPLCYAAIFVGLTISPVDPRCNDENIIHLYSISQPKILFCDGIDYLRLKRVASKCNLEAKIYTMKNHLENVPTIEEFLMAKNLNDFEVSPLKFGNGQTLAVFPSSGTTGVPKSICVTYEGMLNNSIPNDQGDSILYFSTLHWILGLALLVNATLMNMTRIITENSFSPQEFFGIVQKYRPSNVFMPPSFLTAMLGSHNIKSCDFSCLKSCLIGGTCLQPKLVEEMKKFAKCADFVNCYGMTEANGVCVAKGPVRSDGGIGPLDTNAEVKIIDEAGDSLGPNHIGEICFNSRIHKPGYYKNPKATALSFDSENWFYTGDLGYMNDDGILFVEGRKNDTIKYKSFHIRPMEIESVLYEMDGILEVSVCGLPDPISSELPAAAVVLKKGFNLTAESISEHVANRLDDFMQLRGGVFIVDSLPKTPTSKLRRQDVAALCLELSKKSH